MNKRPIAVTVIAWLLVASGVFALAVHARELVSSKVFHFEDLWVPMVALLPAASGVFILLGHHWARWLALAWMAFHVAISVFDSMPKLVVHVLLLALIAYALFHAEARAYFRHRQEMGT